VKKEATSRIPRIHIPDPHGSWRRKRQASENSATLNATRERFSGSTASRLSWPGRSIGRPERRHAFAPVSASSGSALSGETGTWIPTPLMGTHAIDWKLEAGRGPTRSPRRAVGRSESRVGEQPPAARRRRRGRYQRRVGMSSGNGQKRGVRGPDGKSRVRARQTSASAQVIRASDRGRGGRLSAWDAQAGQRTVRKTTRVAGQSPDPSA
jgi:hypothetical protein